MAGTLRKKNHILQSPLYFKKLLHLSVAKSWGTFSPSSKICSEESGIEIGTVINYSIFLFHLNSMRSQAWWYMSAIPALGRRIEGSRPAWAT
jgi:hypothetical protein